jgi:hypothetical protein
VIGWRYSVNPQTILTEWMRLPRGSEATKSCGMSVGFPYRTECTPGVWEYQHEYLVCVVLGQSCSMFPG